MGSRANYVVVDKHGWRLFYSQWGGQLVDRHLASGPGYALRFIEEQAPVDRETGWLDDVWAEGGVVMDTVARRLLFFGGEATYRLDDRRAYFALLEQTWPGWTVAWAYNEIVDIASYVDVEARVVLDSDPPAVTASSPLVQRPPTRHIARGDWALLSVRTNANRVRAWPIKAVALGHLAWAGERLLTVLPGAWRARRAIEGLPPVYGLHLDLAGRRMGWWTAASSLSFELMPLRWPGWEVEFWQDRYENQIAACAGSVHLPAIDLERGLDAVEQRLAVELGDPVDVALRLFDQLRAEGKAVELTPYSTAHTELAVDGSELRILADGLAAVRAQWSKR